ncbi:MAG: PAS domain-containing protein [Ferrovibrio sp.]|uniref:PAS domain-containing protein n=1 Tax=Ferrovibrio sp. TaxID=1917215 RepID=UPI0026169B75|nr:PAS domain-containing protein [Ferrovibrio sp.]MCW0233103.1 PAS domain-containing protein [Ferrovibrio sp.]
MIQPPSYSAIFPAASGEHWHIVRAAESGEDWHPQARQLLFHWMRACGSDGQLPGRTTINHPGLDNLLPSLWMLDVERTPWRFRYRMAGAEFTAAIGREVGTGWYDELRPLAWIANRRRLITTARNGLPTWSRGPLPLEADVPASCGECDVENLILPLACDGVTVDSLLGITVPYKPDQAWRTAAPQAAQ